MIFVYAAREEAQRAEEVDVAFRDASSEELPADLPPLDDTVPPPRATPEHARTGAKTRRKEEEGEEAGQAGGQAARAAQPKQKPEPEVPVAADAADAQAAAAHPEAAGAVAREDGRPRQRQGGRAAT